MLKRRSIIASNCHKVLTKLLYSHDARSGTFLPDRASHS
jgi:hypothetical protein